MLTKKDFRELEKRFVTREYLDKRFESYDKSLKMYLDARFKPLEDMSKEFYTFKDAVLSRLDWLIGQYKRFDEDRVVLSGRYVDVQKNLENHETRIVKLETKSS